MIAFFLAGLLAFFNFSQHGGRKDHDIHVCISEVRWNEASASFEVSIKVFIDDLETALSREKVTGLYIGTPKETKDADTHIASYLDKHFHIAMDGIRLPAEFVGKEVAEDYLAIWCYVEFPGFKEPKSCTVSNDILFELYEDQRNIMDIRMSKTHKAYTIFDPAKSAWNYTF